MDRTYSDTNVAAPPPVDNTDELIEREERADARFVAMMIAAGLAIVAAAIYSSF